MTMILPQITLPPMPEIPRNGTSVTVKSEVSGNATVESHIVTSINGETTVVRQTGNGTVIIRTETTPTPDMRPEETNAPQATASATPPSYETRADKTTVVSYLTSLYSRLNRFWQEMLAHLTHY